MEDKIDIKDFFDRRAKFYKKVSNWSVNTELNLKTDEFLESVSGNIAIELGAGTGVLISKLKNFNQKIALDISAEMLSEIDDPSIKKVIGNVHNLDFPKNYFDLIICRQLLHYCNLDLAFKNIKKVLKNNGYLHIVQVVEFNKVPENWDQKWVNFRNVKNRKQLRTKELESYYSKYSFEILKIDTLIIKDNYAWPDFFKKHNVAKNKEESVKLFFIQTPKYIAKAINLEVNITGISYDRLFKFWLLRNSSLIF